MRVVLLLLCLPLAACTALPAAHAGASPHAERIAAAEATYAAMAQQQAMGGGSIDDVCAWSVRWHQAQKDAGDASAGAAHLARMEALAAKVNKDVEVGMATPRDGHAMRFFVAEAKVWNAKAE